MSEEKAISPSLESFLVPLAHRILELGAEAQGKKYEGSTRDEVDEVLGKVQERFGGKITEEQIEKSYKTTIEMSVIQWVPGDDPEAVIYHNNYDYNSPEGYDGMLEERGILEIIPRKVKLNIDL